MPFILNEHLMEKLYQTYVAPILNTDQFRVKTPAGQNQSIDAIFNTNSLVFWGLGSAHNHATMHGVLVE